MLDFDFGMPFYIDLFDTMPFDFIIDNNGRTRSWKVMIEKANEKTHFYVIMLAVQNSQQSLTLKGKVYGARRDF